MREVKCDLEDMHIKKLTTSRFLWPAARQHVSYNAVLPLWLLQIGVAVRLRWGTQPLHNYAITSVGVAAEYLHNYSNLQ